MHQKILLQPWRRKKETDFWLLASPLLYPRRHCHGLVLDLWVSEFASSDLLNPNTLQTIATAIVMGSMMAYQVEHGCMSAWSDVVPIVPNLQKPSSISCVPLLALHADACAKRVISPAQ